MDYALFNGILERLNADCLEPRFKLGQAGQAFLLEPLLSIRRVAVNLFLQLDSDPLRISQAPGRGFCLCIG